MDKPYVAHEDATIESFKKDPEYAIEYLNVVLEDGTQEELMLALRRIASAHGMKDIAETARLNPKTLYRTLSPSGNPELKNFQAILDAMGMRLAVTANRRQKKGERKRTGAKISTQIGKPPSSLLSSHVD